MYIQKWFRSLTYKSKRYLERIGMKLIKKEEYFHEFFKWIAHIILKLKYIICVPLRQLEVKVRRNIFEWDKMDFKKNAGIE